MAESSERILVCALGWKALTTHQHKVAFNIRAQEAHNGSEMKKARDTTGRTSANAAGRLIGRKFGPKKE